MQLSFHDAVDGYEVVVPGSDTGDVPFSEEFSLAAAELERNGIAPRVPAAAALVAGSAGGERDVRLSLSVRLPSL